MMWYDGVLGNYFVTVLQAVYKRITQKLEIHNRTVQTANKVKSSSNF